MRRVCLEPGCSEFSEYRGRCIIHSKERQGVIRDKESQRVYNTARWRILRRKRLSIDTLCVRCGELACDVDHITPIASGGQPYDLTNTQSLCSRCHGEKTRAEQMRTK